MTPTRREVLAALLGAPGLALIGGCKRRAVPVSEVVGGDVALGHVVRSEPPPLRNEPPDERVPVVIVGAGMSGLSSAWRLSGDGRLPYLLLELESVAGGTSRYGENEVSAYPWAAHYVPVPNQHNSPLVRLLTELDVLDPVQSREEGRPIGREEFLITEPEERVFYRGQWHGGLLPRAAMSPADVADMHRFEQEIAQWVAWRDARGRRAFTLPIAMGSDDAEVTALDRISMATWLDQRGYQSDPFRWYVDFACRDDYGCNIDNTSAWAGLFYFAARIAHPNEPSAPFLTWPEGNGRLVRHLREIVGPRLRCRQLVVDITPRRDDVLLTIIDGTSRSSHTLAAQQVIVAFPRFIQRRVLRPLRESPPEDLGFDTSPWLVANLTLSRRPRERQGFVPAWDNVMYDSPSLGYVSATHQYGRRFGPTVWTYYYPLTDADPKRARNHLLSTTREEWVEVILTDLSRAHPDIWDCVERVDLMRWGHAMVRPTPGFVWSRTRRRASEPLGERIQFAHTELSSVPLVEEALYHGVRAAEAVLRGGRFDVDSWL